MSTLKQNENGQVEEVLGDDFDVTASVVNKMANQLLPMLKDSLGESVGQLVRDQMEQSLEDVAKAQEARQPINAKSYAHQLLTGADEAETERKTAFGEYFAAMGLAKGRKSQAIEICKERGNNSIVRKALEEGDFGSLGMLVPESIKAGIIELRDNASVMRRIAPPALRLKGKMSIPRESTRAVAYWADESEDLTLTSVSVTKDEIFPKKLTVLMVASNELLQDGVNISSFMTRHMARALRLEEDLTFLRGDGLNKKPLGLKGYVSAANTFASTGGATATVDEIFGDLIEARRLMKAANHEVSASETVQIMNSTTWAGLAKKLSTDDAYRIFLPELMSGRLIGLPYEETNQLPDDIAGNQSEFYMVNRSYIVIADAEEMRLEASRDASYMDSGSLVSAWSRDQTAYRLITRTDFYYEHTDGLVLINEIDNWNA